MNQDSNDGNRTVIQPGPQVIDQFQSGSKANPQHIYFRANQVQAFGIHAAALARIGKFDQAQKKFDQTIELCEQNLDHKPILHTLIRAYNNLARMQHEDLGQLEQAQATLLRSVEICKQELARVPNDLGLAKSLGVGYGNLLEIAIQENDLEKAGNYARLQYETMHPLFLALPDNREFQNRVVGSLNDLAKVQLLNDDLEQAIRHSQAIAELDPESSELAYRSARGIAKTWHQLERTRARQAMENPDFDFNRLNQQMAETRARALEQLKLAIERGYRRRDAIESKDGIWQPFRDSPEFTELVESIPQ